MVNSIRPLTQEQRQTASKAAHEVVIRASGVKPTIAARNAQPDDPKRLACCRNPGDTG
jgi:hypothetical protein